MPFSSGAFSLVAGNPVVTATTISSTVQNNTMSDVATGLSTCILKDGTQTATARVPFAQGISTFGTSAYTKIIGFTRDLTASSGDVAYTGVGFTPNLVVFFAGGPAALVGGGSFGMDDGTNHKAIIAVASTPGAFASDASHSISINETAGSVSQTAVVKTFDSNGFTLTWAKTGSPSAGTNQIYALCFKAT